MKKKVLFVCLGNICRSPGAEAVFRSLVEKTGLSEDFEIDSAGTSDWHEGEPADRRMQKHAHKRGYDLTSLSRPVNTIDFEEFDYIVAMDHENLKELRQMAPDPRHLKKLYLITDFNRRIMMAFLIRIMAMMKGLIWYLTCWRMREKGCWLSCNGEKYSSGPVLNNFLK